MVQLMLSSDPERYQDPHTGSRLPACRGKEIGLGRTRPPYKVRFQRWFRCPSIPPRGLEPDAEGFAYGDDHHER